MDIQDRIFEGYKRHMQDNYKQPTGILMSVDMYELFTKELQLEYLRSFFERDIQSFMGIRIYRTRDLTDEIKFTI